MGTTLPPTAGKGLVSFVDTRGKPVEVCADHVLNGKTWHEFNLVAGQPLILDDTNPCEGVVIEANYHNPGASLCGRPTKAAAAGLPFSGTVAYGAQAVAVRANRCGGCVPPSCKDGCKVCEVIRMPGANASSLVSDVNSGWAQP